MEVSRTIEDHKQLFYWELAGLFWIIVVGSLLHFTYQWSGRMALVGIFSAVNESVWEHLKLGYWSLFFFSIIEYSYLKDRIRGFFTAKLTGILAMEGFIVAFFYTYTALTRHSILWLDIGSYILGAFICQLISFQLLKRDEESKINSYSLYIFLLLGLLFAVFTFYPPHLPIFRE